MNVEPILQLFKHDLAVVNLGLASFAENLTANGAKATAGIYLSDVSIDIRLKRMCPAIRPSSWRATLRA